MLVMTRRIDESILVDRHIEITVVEIRGDKVRLGITAPREVPVHRREVFEAIHGVDGSQPGDADHDGTPSKAETPEPASVDLLDGQIALLDRLRDSIRTRSGVAPCREETLGAILSAIHEAEETFGEPATLEHLRASLVSAIKATAPSK